MAFEYRFNVIRFYSKLNRFVLSPRKKPNHFVLKIRPGGFADYIYRNVSINADMPCCIPFRRVILRDSYP